MLPSRAVCSRCAFRVSALAALRQPNRGSFSTLTEAAIEAEIAAAHDKHPGLPGHRRTAHSQRRNESSESSAVALFNDVVKPEVGVERPQRSALSEWAIAGRMRSLEEMDGSTEDKLKYFIEEVRPQMEALGGKMPKHLHNSQRQFLRRSYDAAVSTQDVQAMVTLAEVYNRVCIWDYDVRNGLMLHLCHSLITGARSSSSSEKRLGLRALNRLWELTSQMKRRSEIGKRIRYVLPSHMEILKSMAMTSRTNDPQAEPKPILTRALGALFPLSFLEQSQKLSAGFLATLTVLSETDPDAEVIRGEAMYLLDRLDVALRHTTILEKDVADAFAGGCKGFPKDKLDEVEAYVRENWQNIPSLLGKDATWRKKFAFLQKSNNGDPKGIDAFHSKLRAVYRADARNAGAVSALWMEFQSYLKKQPEALGQLRNNPEFLDFWVFVWCAVRRPDRLQDTLAFMQQVETEPTIKTYTAMMHGWKMSKDVEKIEALWEKLVESKFELDVVIWTERISALIELGRTQKGIQALAEMLAQWKKAHAKNPNTMVPKPNTETINAVFKGLIITDPAAAQTVLTWAGREGIEPNVRTFNILLRDSFKNGKFNEVQAILKTMQNQGIEPDAATFTIMLEDTLGDMHNAPAAEQIQAVEHVLEDIQLAGLQANAETYGKMLYAVAAMPQAEPAIQAIQAHMRSAGLAVTPHMVTILIERALNHPNPDFRSIKALVQEHQLTHVRQGDQTMWERVMSAYAVTGHITDALKVFDDLAGAGRPVSSLPCLKDLLVALLHAGHEEDAARVVATVLRNKLGDGNKPVDDRYWRHNFWHIARRHGLLRQGLEAVAAASAEAASSEAGRRVEAGDVAALEAEIEIKTQTEPETETKP